jgi:hypothetical protein
VRLARDLWLRIAVGVAAIAVRVSYFNATDYDVRHGDVRGHIAYIEYLVDHHGLPRNGDGYSFYHPPLYYLLSALQWTLLASFHVGRESILHSLQIQSMVWELGFALFTAATAALWIDALPPETFGARLLARGSLVSLSAALALLWPSSVIHGVQIGNDDCVYLWFGASTYFTSRWWLRGQDADRARAAVCAGLGVVTKTNALLLFIVLGVLHVARTRYVEKKHGLADYARGAAPIAAAAAVSSLLALGTALPDFLAGKRQSLLVGNVELVPPTLRVGNGVANYLWFDARTFVVVPFSSSWDDEHGRQWFWNFLLKTGLFGDFEFFAPSQRALARAISLLLLILLVVLVVLVLRGAVPRGEWPLGLQTVTFVASLAAMRILHPYACANDFRYILPAIGPLIILYVCGLARARSAGRPGLAAFAAVAAWSFCALSTVFLLDIPY